MFLNKCLIKFSHGTEANVFHSNALQPLLEIKGNMQTWVCTAVEKDHVHILECWSFFSPFNLFSLLLILLSCCKRGKLDCSDSTIYRFIFDITFCT